MPPYIAYIAHTCALHNIHTRKYVRTVHATEDRDFDFVHCPIRNWVGKGTMNFYNFDT